MNVEAILAEAERRHPTPQEIGEMLYRIIEDTVAKKSLVKSKRPNLSTSKQTDIAKIFRIDVEYQVEPDSIKDHFVVRIIIDLRCGDISLFIRDAITPKRFRLSDFHEVRRQAKTAIAEF